MTFLYHKEHGANNVSESEVPEMVKIGWVVSTHAEWMAMHGKGPKIEAPAEPVQVGERKKPGRKPKAE